MRKILVATLGLIAMSSAIAGGWEHVNSRHGYYGNTNHTYVSPRSMDNNGNIKVMEVIENGPRHGNYAMYMMRADCSDGTVIVTSNIEWFDAEQNFLEERTPSKTGWRKATGEKDVAVWNYVCR